MVLGRAGPVDVALSHTPIAVQIRLRPGVALTESFRPRGTDRISVVVVALREAGRGCCGNGESKGKGSQRSFDSDPDRVEGRSRNPTVLFKKPYGEFGNGDNSQGNRERKSQLPEGCHAENGSTAGRLGRRHEEAQIPIFRINRYC